MREMMDGGFDRHAVRRSLNPTGLPESTIAGEAGGG
jgi:hypothetical protein